MTTVKTKAILLGFFLAVATQNLMGDNKKMRISVKSDGKTTVYKLNNSKAAIELYSQLPLNIKVEDYGDDEKIFYPPTLLSTVNTPLSNAKKGTLAYFAPWKNVVMFYKDFGSYNELYELGFAINGIEHIKNMSGIIEIQKNIK